MPAQHLELPLVEFDHLIAPGLCGVHHLGAVRVRPAHEQLRVVPLHVGVRAARAQRSQRARPQPGGEAEESERIMLGELLDALMRRDEQPPVAARL